MIRTEYQRNVRINGRLSFRTAFHIGSGKEGDLATDMGVLKDIRGWPVLPGSTLKGAFRATADRFAQHLGLKACMSDASLSGVECIGDNEIYKMRKGEYEKLCAEKTKFDWIMKNTCDVCRLFGSPMHASSILFRDCELKSWNGAYEVRDGVAIDRDSGTARPRLKYNFEVTPRETEFSVRIDLENPTETDLLIVAAVLGEWQAGFRLGGFTSRGFGDAIISGVSVEFVDFKDPQHLKDYLLRRKMQPAEEMLSVVLENYLSKRGEPSC